MRVAANETSFQVLDLFSGIGGFSLGLERTGAFRTVAFCDIEPFARSVLARRWPGVPIFDDVRGVSHATLASKGILPDVICGGFPCQDISLIGNGAGLEGERSGLWSEIVRLSREIRPRYVIVENVSALLVRGLGRVLGDLAAIGYDAEWHCIPASYVGAPHRRDRIWIVAYPGAKAGRHLGTVPEGGGGRAVSHDSGPRGGPRPAGQVADADGDGLSRGGEFRDLVGASGEDRIFPCSLAACSKGAGYPLSLWPPEPDVGRMVDGLPNQLDRLKGLGNAVVPDIPEILGRAILDRERRTACA